MKRIDVIYGGVRYTIADRELSDLKGEIEHALRDGTAYWLTVNHGEGTLHEAELLITPGVSVAVMALDPESEEPLEPSPVAFPTAGV